jgi:hypothetical protein
MDGHPRILHGHTPNAKVLQVLREAHGPHKANHFDGAEDADHAHDLLGKHGKNVGNIYIYIIDLGIPYIIIKTLNTMISIIS